MKLLKLNSFGRQKFCNQVTSNNNIIWLANHPFLAVVDWIAKGAAQRGRTEGTVLPARRSTPEHDQCMTAKHSTIARWIRLGVDFEEGGNLSTRRKPSKSGWDRLKVNPHTTSRYQPRPTVFPFGEQTLFPSGVNHPLLCKDNGWLQSRVFCSAMYARPHNLQD